MDIERRDLLKLGASGAVATGLVALGTLAGPGRAVADEHGSKLGGIHIHASLGGNEPVLNGRLIALTAYGPDDDLGGSGWDANPESPGSKEAAGTGDRTQCFWTVQGSVDGDMVHLKGRNLFWHLPGDDGAKIDIEANLATGAITWKITEPGAGSGGHEFVFEGTGVVGRI